MFELHRTPENLKTVAVCFRTLNMYCEIPILDH